MEFQLVGTRATVCPCGIKLAEGIAVKLVMIYRSAEIEAQDIIGVLEQRTASVGQQSK